MTAGRKKVSPLFFSMMVIAVACASARAQAPQRLTLAEAQRIAVQNHPLIRAAQFRAQAAQQVTVETRAAYYPNSFGSLTGVEADQPNSRIEAGALNNPIIYNRYANGITVDQLITDFGRTSNLVRSSSFDAQAQQQNVAFQQENILLQVDQGFYAVLRSQAVLKVAQETVDARQVLVNQVTALQQASLKSALDVSFATVNLAQAKLLLVQAQNDLQASFMNLSTAMGFDTPQTFDLVEEPPPSAPPSDISQLVADALKERPDLQTERLKDESAAKFATAERDLWMPTVSAIGVAGVAPVHQNTLSDRYAAAGVNVNIPVFNGHLFSSRSTEARLREQAQGQNVRDLQDRISRDVRVAWLNMNTAYQRLGLTAQLLDQAALALNLAQGRYNLGLSSIVELTQAQLNKTEAEIEQASATYDYQASLATLNYQVGTLR